jgi:nifR3 family TIM-barrel protein
MPRWYVGLTQLVGYSCSLLNPATGWLADLSENASLPLPRLATLLQPELPSHGLPLVPSRLQYPLHIGSLTLHSRVFQSPLAGVTDLVFRRFVRRWAPRSMLYTEMVSASGLHHVNGLPQVMEIDPGEQPISIQLFDCRPDFMAEAAQKAVAEGALTIDINMGCPVNKVTRRGGGSSLLRQPAVAEAIVRAVVAAVDVPVTVKTRLGWGENEITILEFAQRLEAAGAQMITVHGRTRQQGFHGPACWEWIRRVKQTLTIPVIANGDITSVEAALRCLEETGADGVMCARGTLGNPWLVGEIDQVLRMGDRPGGTTTTHRPASLLVPDRLRCALEHTQALVAYKGQRGLFQARKHLSWYVKGFPGANELRDRLMRAETLAETERLLGAAIEVAEFERAIAQETLLSVVTRTD